MLVYQMAKCCILESGIIRDMAEREKKHILKLNQPELNKMPFYSLYLAEALGSQFISWYFYISELSQYYML